MSFQLTNHVCRWAIVLFTALVCLLVSYSAGRSAFADDLENSPQKVDWLRAAQLEPANADYWYKLGFYQQMDFENPNTNLTIEYFRRAVNLDPRSARYWIALGEALETGKQLPQARQAFESALAAYPLSTQGHWSYGNFLLRQGDLTQSYSEIRQALVGDPTLIALGVSRIWHATHDAAPILDGVLPDSQEARQLALNWFCSDNDSDAALIVWERMVKDGQTIPIQVVFPMIDMLLGANRGEEARKAWRKALIASGNPEAAQAAGSLVSNGGFEYDAIGGGLDWRLAPHAGIKYAYDSANAHSGQRALRVTFDGSENITFGQVTQNVPVEPNTRYLFEGFLRTAGITTDSGIRFVVSFPGTTQPFIMLANLVGDHPWDAQRAEFITAANSHLVQIQLFRAPSNRYDKMLKGTVWVDDVSITPAGTSPP